jgi:hypothetical protein
MSIFGRLFTLFPIGTFLLAVIAFVSFLVHPTGLRFFEFLCVVYLFPLCMFRLMRIFFPIEEGVSHLDGKRFSPWWGAHQMQGIYNAFPQIEIPLRLIPGVFSWWLRLWGSNVGKSVYWTPRVEITDRNLLQIGDRVVFGHKVECYSHVIKPHNGHIILYVKKVLIGNDVFIGAGTRIGPGVKIPSGSTIPLLSVLSVNQTFGSEKLSEPAYAS